MVRLALNVLARPLRFSLQLPDRLAEHLEARHSFEASDAGRAARHIDVG